MRYRQVDIVFKALFIILVLGLFYIQVVLGNRYYDLSKRNIIRVVSLEAARGKILDRNGTVLADTIPSFNISVVPQEIKNKTNLFKKLSKLLKIPLDEIKQSYKKNYFNPFSPVKIYEKLNMDEIIILEENKLSLPGVIIDSHPQRFYPFRKTASHILGYLGQINISRITRLKSYGYELSDLVGYSGIEEYYDLFLRGEKGGEQIEVDNRGNKVRTVGYKPPESGKDIQITIDIRIQELIDKVMGEEKGSVVILDPYSGEVIALGSYPGFDPNHFVEGRDKAITSLLNDTSSPLFNRAITGQFPPGSVFKVVTAVSALEKKQSLIHKEFVCEGSKRIGDRDYMCSGRHGLESLRDAIVHSCNVYFYNLGMLIGPDTMNKYSHMLGLGRRTGIDLKYETKGFIPSPYWKKIMRFQNWYKGDTANMAIGQGEVLVSPLQMARMISIFVNGGKLVRPHLIKAVDNKQVDINKDNVVKLKNKDILKNISNYLFDVVNNQEGTAHATDIKGLKIYAKTGTAQASGSEAHGWLVGYVGRNKPKYAFSVFMENAGSSQVACLVTKRILEEMISRDLI